MSNIIYAVCKKKKKNLGQQFKSSPNPQENSRPGNPSHNGYVNGGKTSVHWLLFGFNNPWTNIQVTTRENGNTILQSWINTPPVQILLLI